ncbi:MAG: hypothetical protein ACRDTG_16570 [Pseudonocardiaceae bacterium]
MISRSSAIARHANLIQICRDAMAEVGVLEYADRELLTYDRSVETGNLS